MLFLLCAMPSGPSSQADSCTLIRKDTEFLKLGRMLLHQPFWSPGGNVANGTAVPRNLLAFCIQSSTSEEFVCWETEVVHSCFSVVWSNYTSACADDDRGTRVPGKEWSAYKLYVLMGLFLFLHFSVQVHLWHAKWVLCFGFETRKRFLIRKKHCSYLY